MSFDGSGFLPYEAVSFRLVRPDGGVSVNRDEIKTDGDGNFTFEFLLTRGEALGVYEMHAEGAQSRHLASFYMRLTGI